MVERKDSQNSSTGRVTVDNDRIDRLKAQLMSTPQSLDNERVRIMAEVYEGTAGYQQIIRRAKFFAELIERKKLYIDENLIVGSMASTVNARLHVSGMERRVDEGREDRREVEDPGRPQGEPVGARVLGQVGAAAAGRRDLHQEVRL